MLEIYVFHILINDVGRWCKAPQIINHDTCTVPHHKQCSLLSKTQIDNSMKSYKQPNEIYSKQADAPNLFLCVTLCLRN